MDEQRKVFGMLDFGEFPLLRYCDFEIGLMPEGELIRAVVYDISQTPGADTELSFIEVSTIVAADVIREPSTPGDPVDPEDPEDPKEDPRFGDPTDTATVDGTIPVVVEAEPISRVSLVKVYLDGTLWEMSNVPTTGYEHHFSLDTTTLSEGSHTLKATSLFTDGTTQSVTITVTVDNVA